MKTLFGLTSVELRGWAQSQGMPAFRGQQIADWLYRKGAESFAAMTNLPLDLRGRLSQSADLGHLPVVARAVSDDRTIKLLLARRDGEQVESVGLPYPDRVACCLSSQVGCPIGCTFCATGLSGFTGNLDAGEIVAQVLAVQRELGQRVSHVVFMGMGEPLLNYDAVLKSVRLLNEEVGVAMRHITVSTVGLVPQMRRLADERLQLTLAVSLHAPTNELRHELVPGTRGFTVEEIVNAAKLYATTTGRRVTFEYVLLRGVNDRPAEARALAKLLRDCYCHVNLIPFNPVDDTGFQAPTLRAVRHFRNLLEAAKITVTQRVQRGASADAACGQLRRRLTTAKFAVSSEPRT